MRVSNRILSVLRVLSLLFLTGITKADQDEAGNKLEFTLGMYQVDCKQFPPTLIELTKKPKGKCPNWGPDPYLSSIPKDRWGHDWVYSSDGKSYVLKSLGKDGKPGGTGDDADITYDELLKYRQQKTK
jgi:general secretion pathway protein G